MNEKVVFCTSLIDRDVNRYQNWINYYTNFFKECGVDLFMINDGPVESKLDLKGVELKQFDKKLGRETVWIFPGWKRSFFHAILLFSGKYKYIGHIESDCWVSKNGKEDFLHYLGKEGYYTGFTPAYNFPEAALQIINSQSVRQYLLDKYSCVENWRENIDFEQDLRRLEPVYILNGDRIEKEFTRFKQNFTFVSSVTYEDFERLYGKDG